MKWENLFISGVGSCLPDRMSAADSVQRGLYPLEEHEDNDIAQVAVSAERAAPELAVDAARQAMTDSGHGVSDVEIMLHASIYYQGQDLWSPASYVQREVVGGTAPAIGLDGASNGAFAGLELAASYLAPGSGRRAALVTTGDRFCPPGFDRWNGDSGVVYGDGASAIVLSRSGGFAEVLASNITGGPELEPAARADGFGHAPLEHARPLDLAGRKAAFIKSFGYTEFMDRLAHGVLDNVRRTLDEADCDIDDVACFVLPNFGLSVLEWEFLEPLELPLGRTLFDWGRQVGHLGAGDQFAGLRHLLDTGRASSGETVLLAGCGLGFNWGSTLLKLR